jgi:hypothetical protein
MCIVVLVYACLSFIIALYEYRCIAKQKPNKLEMVCFVESHVTRQTLDVPDFYHSTWHVNTHFKGNVYIHHDRRSRSRTIDNDHEHGLITTFTSISEETEGKETDD